MPVDMQLALLGPLGVPYTVLPHRRQVEACADHLGRQRPSSNQQGSGANVVLEGPNSFLIEQALKFVFKASNNQAEYEALKVFGVQGGPR